MTSSNTRPIKILFVCVGNACRSPMAEAWARHYGNGRGEGYSAGSHAYGQIIADTYAVMKEKGISLEGQKSKGLRDVPFAEMDIVVRMGTEVECTPPAGFKGRVEDWRIADPYARGLETFRIVRDQIELEVQGLIAELPATAPKPAK
jgi:arsenate reductase (thioredoxin)